MDILYFLSAIIEGLKKALGIVADNFKANTNLKKQQTLQIQKQQDNERYLITRREIQQELFHVFYGKNYPLLYPVENTSSIIPLPYEVTPQGVKYKYNILAKEHSCPEYFFQQIKEHMLYDIYEYQQSICGYDPVSFQLALFEHPYIMYGLYVINVKRDGAYLTITVTTNYTPSY